MNGKHRALFSYPLKMEITLETNPEDVDVDLMRAYADVGINRVSIGMQTLDDTLLKRMLDGVDLKAFQDEHGALTPESNENLACK